MRRYTPFRAAGICSAVIFLISLTGWARADHKSELDQARRTLDRAEARLSAAICAVDAAQSALQQARWARDSSTRDLESTIASIQHLESSLRDAESAIGPATARLEEASRLVPEHQSAVADLERRLREASSVVERIRADARARFEQSPEYVDAVRSLDAAAAGLDRQIDRVLADLDHDAQFIELRDQAARAEAVVKALRADRYAPAEDLAAASKIWIEAKSAVTRFIDDATDRDPSVREARQLLEQSQARLEAINEVFERSLEANLDFQAALVGRDVAAQALHTAQRDLSAAEQARQSADAELGALHGNIAQIRSQLEVAAPHADSLRRAISSAESDIWRLEQDLDRAISAQSYALSERDRAEHKYRKLLELCQETPTKPIFVGPRQHPHRRHDDRHKDDKHHKDHNDRKAGRDRHHRHDKDDKHHTDEDRPKPKPGPAPAPPKRPIQVGPQPEPSVKQPPKQPDMKQPPRKPPVHVGPEPEAKPAPRKPAPPPKQPIRVGPEPEVKKPKPKSPEQSAPRPREPIRVGPEPPPKSEAKKDQKKQENDSPARDARRQRGK